MSSEKLAESIELHSKWLTNHRDGRRMSLRGPNLRGDSLRWANLRWANLSRADLSKADLSGANLTRSNLNGASLRGANLRWANLSGTYLNGADLSKVDLRWANGNNAEILSLQTGKYPITRTKEIMAIGCEQHSIEDWMAFDDTRIKRMDNGALKWWKVWKPIIQQWIELT